MRKFLACSVVGIAVFGGALVACSSGGGGGSQQAFCDALKKDQSAFSDLSNQSDLTDAQSLSAINNALGDLVNKAPSEIKGDMQTVANAAKSSFSALSEFSSAAKGGDLSKLSDLEKQFSDQNKGLDAAEQNVEKYAKDKCGVDITGSGSESSSSRSSSSRSSSSSNAFSDLSDLSSLSNFSDLSSLSNLTSDLSSLTDLSSLDSVLSSLSSAFSR
jgi:hypothetical protein